MKSNYIKMLKSAYKLNLIKIKPKVGMKIYNERNLFGYIYDMHNFYVNYVEVNNLGETIGYRKDPLKSIVLIPSEKDLWEMIIEEYNWKALKPYLIIKYIRKLTMSNFDYFLQFKELSELLLAFLINKRYSGKHYWNTKTETWRETE